MDFIPHSEKQERAIFSEKPIVVAASGIQWGKTRVGAIKTKMSMHTHIDPEDAFLIVAPTYKIMQQSTLPAFLRIMDGCGEYSKADALFKMSGGGICYMRTATDPDSVVGITNVRFIWGDEAGLYSLYFWENIQARAAFKEAQIVLTTSPYSLNWIYKEIIRPKMKDGNARGDCELIQAASWENPHFPKGSIERARATMDPRRFNMAFGGKWDKMEGLVYEVFDESENVCDPFALPIGTRYFAGVDWGYNHPFAMVIRALTPNGMHYQVGEVYKSGLSFGQVLEIAAQKKAVYGIERFICDPSQPGYIGEFNRNGLTATAANNDIKPGISKHQELIKSRRYKVFRGSSPFTIDEYEMYHYPGPDDLKPDDDAEDPNPVKQHDDAMDANRYVTMDLYHSASRLKPKLPGEGSKVEDVHAKMERLKRRSGYGPQTENW